MVAERFVYCWR